MLGLEACAGSLQPTAVPEPSPTPQPTDTPVPTETPAPTASPTPAYAAGYEVWLAYEGDWSGSWQNKTFGTTGSADATVVVHDDGASEITLDLGGFVFGVVDPPPITLAGTYTTSEATFTLQDDSTFGDITITFTAEGQVKGMVENVLRSTGTIDLTGTLTPERMELNYALALPRGVKAQGVLILDHK